MRSFVLLGSMLQSSSLVKADCTLQDGTVQIGAPSFVCNNLDNTVRRDYHNRCKKWKNAWGDKPECCTKCQSNWRTCYDECNEEIDLTPPELDLFSCDPLAELHNGNVYCTKGALTGSVCLAICEDGFKLEPRGKKRCKHRQNWQKNVEGKAPVKWNLLGQDFRCVKEYIPSPCENNNGGCSHECIDRGDGNHKCVCPCGYSLDGDLKTCTLQPEVCPFDISFYIDQSEAVCNDLDFKSLQINDMGTVIQFFNSEVNTKMAKLGVGLYGDGSLSPIVSQMSDNMPVSQVKSSLVTEYESLTCGAPQMGNIFGAFDDNGREEGSSASKVTFIALGGELDDLNDDLLANRPQSDNVIVFGNANIQSQKYKTQANILACGSEEDCDRVLEMGEFGAADIESRVSRSACYNRVFSSSIACTEFSMELKIPVCALKGLELQDVKFNDESNCNAVAEQVGDHFHWVIDYNDCGTKKSTNSTAGDRTLSFPAGMVGGVQESILTSDEGIISYQNNLKTKFIESGSVFPILPNFDVPLQCDLHTSYDFVFTGDWHPDVSSFKAELSTHFDLEGTMTLFHDGNYTEAFDGLTPVKNGIPIYVQGTMDVPEEYSSDSILIDSCVASPGTLEGLVPVNSNDPFWPLINEGCLNDHTVEILPRGENGEIRFSFEGFTFHSYEDKAINIQCKFKTCVGDDCSHELPQCSRRRRR